MKEKLIIFVVLFVACGFAVFAWENSLRSPVYSSPVVNEENKDTNRSAPLECVDCNVIMISLSNVSAEHMSLYGYERVTTPNLDAWAKDAIVFENAFTQSSWTLPVGVSLFTSLYPYAHGVTDRYENNVLREDIATLPEILRDNGYTTAAFTGGLDYSRVFGHMRGFDEVVEAGKDVNWPTDFAGFSAAFPKAKQWVEKNSENKFFLFLHGYDTHCPFVPPKEVQGTFAKKSNDITIDPSLCYRGYANNETGKYEAYYSKTKQEKVLLTNNDIEYLKDSYDEEIVAVDALATDFLESLDKSVLDKTVVVVFSDHGEMFAKHGRFGRAGAIRGTLYDDVLHVPLIVKVPQYEGKKVGGLTQIIDIMPTVLKILNIQTDTAAQGKDLVSMIETNEESNDFVFSGSEFNVGIFNSVYKQKSVNEAARDHQWKLIHEVKLSESGGVENETFELYDIKNDRDELYNVIDDQAEVAAELKKILSDWTYESKNIMRKGKTEEVPDSLQEEARKRGYW